MYRRLIILTAIILIALCALGLLGYDAVDRWAQGMEGTRLGEFADVAEQVRKDVKRKLDDFIHAEQQRPYTDYLYSYVPENYISANNAQQQEPPLLRSPLGDQISNGLAYGYFQIEPDGRIVTPYFAAGQTPSDQSDEMVQEVQRQLFNIRRNVLPSVSIGSGTLRIGQNFAQAANPDLNANIQTKGGANAFQNQKVPSKSLPIESLNQEAQPSQVFTQQRSVAQSNAAQMQAVVPTQQQVPEPRQAQARPDVHEQQLAAQTAGGTQRAAGVQPPPNAPAQQSQAPGPQTQIPDTVQIRIEPFVTIPVGGRQSAVSAGQVFLLRHVQIADRPVLQGFQLDENRLVAEVRESVQRFMRDGMAFELPQAEDRRQRTEDGLVASEKSVEAAPVAYTAVLAFGFGDLILNLKEIDPQWITKRVGELQHVYLAIVGVVAAAVALALASLWHNMQAQVKLAQKKDDFISAVSHELRTPLTSIRMYAEMLERNWVKSADKLAEYYHSLRQESERLSRLVDNVLDFSRIQKGRKKYAFELGDINRCVATVSEMMKPYAEQYGFVIKADLGPLREMPFDRDAVTQIVVNLIDNAVKYARSAEDKTITVRTRIEGAYTIIEVEDRGPGIPHRQRKKVFEQFYRCSDDRAASDQTPGPASTTGAGLGLTLVKRFAEAHHGYVEVRSAHPTGAVLRVYLAT